MQVGDAAETGNVRSSAESVGRARGDHFQRGQCRRANGRSVSQRALLLLLLVVVMIVEVIMMRAEGVRGVHGVAVVAFEEGLFEIG